MMRIALFTWEGGGNQWPTVALARGLMDRGDDVRVAGYDTQVRPFRALGLDVTVLARGGTGRRG